MELEFNKIILAFLLTLIAGLSTGIGSALAFFTKSTNKKFLSVALGVSAGVMIYVSFVEILNKSKELLTAEFGALKGEIFTILAFFSGIFFIAVIDKFVPSFENPH
ncbi:MAG TPA: ZIP family metal transporter, partial [bacterium]|nr:ZIP family metal transporter [bacterium]